MDRKPLTKAIVKQRVDEILKIRLNGAEIWDVREYVREKEKEEGSAWYLAESDKPHSDGTLWRYMARADKAIARTCQASVKRLVQGHTAKRRHIYAKAVSAGRLDTALRVLDSLAKLQGLFPTAESALTEQLKAATDELHAIRATEKPAERVDGERGDAEAPEGTGEGAV